MPRAFPRTVRCFALPYFLNAAELPNLHHSSRFYRRCEFKMMVADIDEVNNGDLPKNYMSQANANVIIITGVMAVLAILAVVAIVYVTGAQAELTCLRLLRSLHCHRLRTHCRYLSMTHWLKARYQRSLPMRRSRVPPRM